MKKLILGAIEVRKLSYSPYSNFAVGAAIEMANGLIVTGCNFENVSYGGSRCAEQCAIGNAISRGQREIRTVAVVADQEETFTPPCGICRQILSEFVKDDVKVYLSKSDPIKSGVLVTSLFSLLPLQFRL